MTEPNIYMIVDDDRDDRFFFLVAINEVDPACECLTAQNGEQAMEILYSAAKLPDYIFLDINMPGMSGQECLVKIKQDPRLSHISVIMYSTSSYTKEIEQCLRLGASYYLVKQTEVRKLPAEINKALEAASLVNKQD